MRDRWRTPWATIALAVAACVSTRSGGGPSDGAPSSSSGGPTSTAWYDGAFHVDIANVVAQSNVIVAHPNVNPNQSMPLGNGKLGVAVWSANGLTAQLNRVDTFPDRKSPGQVVIPGLGALTGGAGYGGSLDLYDAMFKESGGGMTATAYVLQDKDELVIDVTGADPTGTQTATVQLWPGRAPVASAMGALAVLAESFVDSTTCCGAGGSNQTFGSLAGLTAGGRNVTAAVVNPMTVQVTFNPNPDGTFRIVVASPAWAGSGGAISTVTNLVGADATASASSLQSAHLAFWHDFWAKTGLLRIGSAEGAYVENLRDVDLFLAAASSAGAVPGHHNGAADLFKWNQDSWHPGWPVYEFWHWNLRMQVAANLAAGHPELNAPYFDLYAGNLSNLETWTQDKYGGDGSDICVPEIMRFNGNGAGGSGNQACDESTTTWNGKTLSTGAEVSLWIWNHYLYTKDDAFLRDKYPFMAAAARFLLAFAPVGSDGLRHTGPSNAHETQWDTQDPTTDIAAMRALFPVVIQAAGILGVDAPLVTELQAAQAQIPDFPRTDTATQTQLLTSGSDPAAQDMIGLSYNPTAPRHNTENIGLEVVWPYGLIGDDGAGLTALAQRTFTYRSYVNTPDWTFDAVQAARIGSAADFRNALVNQIQKYQVWASGLGNWTNGSDNLPYDELIGDVANAVQEALVQDYDGLLRIAPAWPSESWDVSGTQYIHGNDVVHVQIEGGKLATVVVEAGSTADVAMRNPWAGRDVEVVDGRSGATVVAATSSARLTIPAQSGGAYVVQPVLMRNVLLAHAQVTAAVATAPRSMGPVTIGVR